MASASSACSPALWRWLTEPTTASESLQGILARPALHAEVRAVAAILAERTRPAGARAVMRVMSPMLSVYGVPDRSEAEWASFWQIFVDALSDLPVEALEGAARAWNRLPDSRHFPDPGPFRALAVRANTAAVAAWRARKAAEQAPVKTVRPDLATRRAQVGELLAGMTRPLAKTPATWTGVKLGKIG